MTDYRRDVLLSTRGMDLAGTGYPWRRIMKEAQLEFEADKDYKLLNNVYPSCKRKR